MVVLSACSFHHGAVASDGSTPDVGMSDGPPDTPLGGVTFVGTTTASVGDDNMLQVPATAMPGVTYVLAIAPKPYFPVAQISGLGATWTAIGDQCGARSQTGASLYVGRGATTSGDITIELMDTPINLVAMVGMYAGSTGSAASARYNALDATSCSASATSVDVAAYAFSIASTGGLVVAGIATRSNVHTPGAGLTQRKQQFTGSGGDVAGLALVDGKTMTVAGTFNAATDVAAVAIELR
jgi:hypothetical protein